RVDLTQKVARLLEDDEARMDAVLLPLVRVELAEVLSAPSFEDAAAPRARYGDLVEEIVPALRFFDDRLQLCSDPGDPADDLGAELLGDVVAGAAASGGQDGRLPARNAVVALPKRRQAGPATHEVRLAAARRPGDEAVGDDERRPVEDAPLPPDTPDREV